MLQPTAADSVPKGSRPVDMSAIKPKSLSLDLERPPSDRPRQTDSPGTPTDSRPLRRSSRLSTSATVSDTKIFIVWLESYEDQENFPSGELAL